MSIEEWTNPILRILRDIDQVFPELDQVSRVAFMYKSHILLKVGLKLCCSNDRHGLTVYCTVSFETRGIQLGANAGVAKTTVRSIQSFSVGRMRADPSRPSQTTKQHPIAIDFFVW